MAKILIVEDDQFLREFYQELLQGEGYNVDVAADGNMALSQSRESGYDLILLDIIFPKQDGLQILKDLKAAQLKKSNGPIVVLTNLGQESIVKKAFTLGAAGYLIKSAMNPDEVLQEIRSYLQKENVS